jgi:DNA polymerase I-like protein with 3'-5' exonuclease and polymerase domains
MRDAEVIAIGKGLKRNDAGLYDACKHVVHMSNYLGSPKRIRMEYPDLFESVGYAKKLQDLYFDTIAKKVKKWQQKTLYTAYQPPHYLENPFKYRHYFWDVLHYRGQQLEWGTDAKKAVAFVPQSTGAGVLSEALLKLAKNNKVFRMLRWVIHDSIVAEIPNDERLFDRIKTIKDAMEAPLPQLGGLSIEVEMNCGFNWGEMEDITLDTIVDYQKTLSNK